MTTPDTASWAEAAQRRWRGLDMTQADWILALVILADVLLALIILGVRR